MTKVTGTPMVPLIQMGVIDRGGNILSMNRALADFFELEEIPRAPYRCEELSPEGRFALHNLMIERAFAGDPQAAVINCFRTTSSEEPDSLRYTEVYLSDNEEFDGLAIWCAVGLEDISTAMVELLTRGGALAYTADTLPATGGADPLHE